MNIRHKFAAVAMALAAALPIATTLSATPAHASTNLVPVEVQDRVFDAITNAHLAGNSAILDVFQRYQDVPEVAESVRSAFFAFGDAIYSIEVRLGELFAGN